MPHSSLTTKSLQQTTLPVSNPLLDGLNTEQLAAVKHTQGPLLIVAGAGTGKTTVITRRIAYLSYLNLAKPDEIAALTFTEKAAGEMQERVDLLLPLGYYDKWICTFHGFCERVLKTHALDIGIPNDFSILGDTQQWIFVYQNLDAFDLHYYKPLGNPGKFISALLSHFSRLKDEVIGPEDYLRYAQELTLNADQPESRKVTKSDDISGLTDQSEILRISELANAYHTYQHLLLKHNYLDFGDLIHYTLQLFAKRPKILKYYQDKFKFIMVDEFQDTNVAQYQLVKLLAGDKQNIAVVGDDDQSIYKFRGASVSNILKFKEDYPAFKQITLVENYRSSQNILDLAYNFIQANNPDRLEVKLAINKQLKSNSKENGTIQVIEADSLQAELNAVVRKILDLRQAAPETISWNDFAILIRSNAAANDLLPLLHSAGIPYTFFASRGLYKKPIIVSLLSYLKLIENCHDSAALYKVFQIPKFYIDHRDLASLLQYSHKKALSLYDCLPQVAGISGLSSQTHKQVALLLATLKKHAQQNPKLHAAEMFVHIVKDLGIEDAVKEETAQAAENRELIEQFYQKIEAFEQANDDKSLKNFLFLLDLEQEAGSEGEIKFNPDLGPESVKVMTIHSAKGLEFTYVFIINMVDQRFPTREKAEAIEIPAPLIKDILPEGDFHLQEERRLFYVAITRAKTHLYLTWAKDYGGTRAKKPSLFLTETELVPSEKINKATGKVVFNKPLKPDLAVYAPPTRFSYSQLNDFETCPLKYKYQHYLKLPVEGSCHLSFGQTIHKVFEEYLKLFKTNKELPQQDLFGGKPENVLPEFKYLEQLYQKHWVDDWYRDAAEKEDYRSLGKTMLKTFYDEMQAHQPTPKYIEQFFKLKIGAYDFVGKIDRADISEHGIEIFDYKTGKIPKKSDKKDLDQLYIYQWAAQDFLKERVTGLTYWFLQANQHIKEPIANQEDILALEARLLETIERIAYVTQFNLFKEVHAKVRDHACDFEFLE